MIAGPLVALAKVPAAMVGVALAAGRPMLAYRGAERFVLYVALVDESLRGNRSPLKGAS